MLSYEAIKWLFCPSILTGTSSTTDSGAQSGAITNEENTGEVAVPMVSTSQDVSGARSLIPPFQDPQQRTGRDSSIGSTSQELWGSLTSHMRSSQLGPVLAVALVAIIVLLQASILDFMQMHFDAD
jgi:hypothetical protein